MLHLKGLKFSRLEADLEFHPALKIFALSLLLSACSGIPSARIPAASGEDWPVIGERESERLMARPACREFAKMLDPSAGGLKTDQLVVVKNGTIVYEWYDKAYGPETPHCLWSASKTVTATIAGAAIQSGMFSLHERLEKFFPASSRSRANRLNPAEPGYRKITLSDLLNMGAGFRWQESYEDAAQIQKSDVLKMVYGSGQKDMLAFALDAPMLPGGPGSQWIYSGGNSNILLGILKQKTGSRYLSAPWELLFDPLGMKNVIFERDGAGNFVGSSYVHSNPRDMARLGMLYLDNGRWKGRQILPEDWMGDSVEISPAQRNKDTPADYIIREGVFGRAFWLNRPIPEKNVPKPFPRSPEEVFFAAGHYGQWIIVFPSQKIILTRTGHDGEYWSKLDDVFTGTLECFGREDE